MSTNFDVLPPEIIEVVFDHTLQCIPAETRSLQALACSHVCRLFRLIALNSPSMWRSLPVRGKQGHGLVKLPFIEACVARSRDLPLDAFLYFYRDCDPATSRTAVLVDSTFETILNLCARWRSCSWKFDEGNPNIDVRLAGYRPFLEVLLAFQWVDAPLLEKLSFEEGPGMDMRTLPTPIRRILSWNMPNLHTFSFDNMLCMPSFKHRIQPRSLKANFFQKEFAHHINSMRSHIKIMRSLLTAQLSFIGCRFNKPSFALFSEMHSIKSLEITLLGCIQNANRPKFLWHEFQSFCFPSLAELHINLDIEDRDSLVLWNGHNIALYSLLAPTLAHDNERRYPSLETLVVTFHSRTKSSTPQDSQSSLPTILLPCCCVPSLKNLHIRSTQRWSLLHGVGEFNSSQPPYFERGGQIVAINLETVTFDVPHVEGIVPWVQQLASSMQSTDCWVRFSELTIVDSGDIVVIPRAEVERWCEDVLKH
ncbi:hypothetical protein SCHPADRAFT_1001290 [Schizopora paradoxa]|uniref:Uncharacterized protein n=1 Tax=Schizopora paradoxa TaxID=27342 RepID=A0A0H2R804_9AGAM|nr:hypothetical protein SCHPADRAFT_1001290 [Schizopora paradoxa]